MAGQSDHMICIIVCSPHTLPSLPSSDEDSGSDEEVLTREAIKKTTALLVEAKTKKKPQDDEEEEEGRGRKRKRR